jgi:hypothetical protein
MCLDIKLLDAGGIMRERELKYIDNEVEIVKSEYDMMKQWLVLVIVNHTKYWIKWDLENDLYSKPFMTETWKYFYSVKPEEYPNDEVKKSHLRRILKYLDEKKLKRVK